MAGETSGEIVRGAFDWAKGQPYQNVMTTVVLAAVITGIPWAVREVKDLYTRQEASHREERTDAREAFAAELTRLSRAVERNNESTDEPIDRRSDRRKAEVGPVPPKPDGT